MDKPKKKNKHGEPVYTTWMGIEFRRYPDSPLKNLRDYWRTNIALHTVVWIFENRKPMPPKGHIHHIDRDSLNNAPENLEALTGHEHLLKHGSIYKRRTPEQLAHLAAMREKTKEWHASPEGRAWHSEHSRKQHHPLREKVCSQCGEHFQDRNSRTKGNTFCSANCRTRWRHSNRLDFEARHCEACGGEFRCNKFNKTRFCSKKCAGFVRRKDPATTSRLQRERRKPARILRKRDSGS